MKSRCSSNFLGCHDHGLTILSWPRHPFYTKSSSHVHLGGFVGIFTSQIHSENDYQIQEIIHQITTHLNLATALSQNKEHTKVVMTQAGVAYPTLYF